MQVASADTLVAAEVALVEKGPLQRQAGVTLQQSCQRGSRVNGNFQRLLTLPAVLVLTASHRKRTRLRWRQERLPDVCRFVAALTRTPPFLEFPWVPRFF